MRQKYDITLKDLLKDIPKVFLKLITGYETGKFLDVQFPDIQLREPDLVFEVEDGKLLHFEIQSQNDDTMLERMYMYSAFIRNQHKKLPVQIVFYVGNAPMNMKNHMEGEGVKFSYRLLDIREIDCSRQKSGKVISESCCIFLICENYIQKSNWRSQKCL